MAQRLELTNVAQILELTHVAQILRAAAVYTLSDPLLHEAALSLVNLRKIFLRNAPKRTELASETYPNISFERH